MTAQPADDWQQNADVALMLSQKLERSEQPGTEEQYRSDMHQCRVSMHRTNRLTGYRTIGLSG